MLRILIFVVGVVGIASLLGKLSKTWAGALAGGLVLLTLAAYKLGDYAPDLLRLACGVRCWFGAAGTPA